MHLKALGNQPGVRGRNWCVFSRRRWGEGERPVEAPAQPCQGATRESLVLCTESEHIPPQSLYPEQFLGTLANDRAVDRADLPRVLVRQVEQVLSEEDRCRGTRQQAEVQK